MTEDERSPRADTAPAPEPGTHPDDVPAGHSAQDPTTAEPGDPGASAVDDGGDAGADTETDTETAEAVTGADDGSRQDGGDADSDADQDDVPAGPGPTGPPTDTEGGSGDDAGTEDPDPDPDAERPDPGAEAVPPARGTRTHLVGASLLIGVLCGLLGFGLAVQVRTTSSTNGLSGARQEDLVRILDDLSQRETRLRQQIASLDSARTKLSSSGDKASVALSEARTRATSLGILAGTVEAQGPGVRVTIDDPGGRLGAEDLLDVIEELRAAGAEAFQVGSVRVGVSSAFTGGRGAVSLDGVRLRAPYVVLAIGDPGTLATALNIPGGVVASVRNAGGDARVAQQHHVLIDAVIPRTGSDSAPTTTGGN